VVVHGDEAEHVVVGLGDGLGRPVLVDGTHLELLEVAAVGAAPEASRAAWLVSTVGVAVWVMFPLGWLSWGLTDVGPPVGAA
jgi:hypothetical protein